MVYYDIHTHHLPVHPEDAAIVNSLVPTFDVGTGLFRSVGIHPWYIYNVEEQLAELKRQVSFPDVVAIGETGLDKGAEAPLDCQREIFRASASFAENAGIFLIIHCVKAWDELIASKKELKPRVPWIIHGFRGNATLAGQLIRRVFTSPLASISTPEPYVKHGPAVCSPKRTIAKSISELSTGTFRFP